MLSRFIRTVHHGLKNLLLHKLRSILTMLGIVFGVFSVIAMLAIGEGASAKAQQQVLELGATNVIVISQKPPEGTAGNDAGTSMLEYGLLRDDFTRIVNTIPTILEAVPIRELKQPARHLHREMEVRLVGCTTAYMDLNHLKLRTGRFITGRDQMTRENIVVLADEAADHFFPIENPVGQSVQIGQVFYRIVGVMKPRTSSAAIGGSLSGQDYSNDAYIPIETLRVRVGDEVMLIQAGGQTSEKVELSQITLRVGKPEDVLKTAAVVRDTLERFHEDKKDFDVVVPLELLQQAEQIKRIFNVVLGSIACISLIVGGIGIMNIMLATVTERTREIGVRRALGAKQKDITVQFLTETTVLAGSGGIAGVVLGLLTPYLFGAVKLFTDYFVLGEGGATSELGRMFEGMDPIVQWWTLGLAFGISVGTGIVFGLYPARAAARLDPIEALRHE